MFGRHHHCRHEVDVEIGEEECRTRRLGNACDHGRQDVAHLRPKTYGILQVLFFVLTILVTLMAGKGGARHIYYLDPPHISTVVKYNWICQPFGIMSVAIGKLAVGLLILRILGSRTFWRKWFLYSSLTFTVLISASCCIINFVQCDPPRALWEQVPGSSCWDPSKQLDYSLFISSKFLPVTV